jgi:hypothetical protein
MGHGRMLPQADGGFRTISPHANELLDAVWELEALHTPKKRHTQYNRSDGRDKGLLPRRSQKAPIART